MPLPPHRARAQVRLWRRLACATLLVLLLASYWIALRALGSGPAEGTPATVYPTPALDLHTPRIN